MLVRTFSFLPFPFPCRSFRSCNASTHIYVHTLFHIERSTTRLHAPPGGKSSFSLSHDEGPGAVVKKTVAPAPVPAPAPTPVAEENVAPQQRQTFNNSGNMAGVFGQAEKPAAARNTRAPPGKEQLFSFSFLYIHTMMYHLTYNLPPRHSIIEK